MKIKKIVILLTVIIVASNLPIINKGFEFFLDEGFYRYSNADGSSTYTEFKTHDFEMGVRRHVSCNLLRPEDSDLAMYRLFAKNPLAFWRWSLYFFDQRYKLPYRDWNEIKNNRRSNYGTGCYQSF